MTSSTAKKSWDECLDNPVFNELPVEVYSTDGKTLLGVCKMKDVRHLKVATHERAKQNEHTR